MKRTLKSMLLATVISASTVAPAFGQVVEDFDTTSRQSVKVEQRITNNKIAKAVSIAKSKLGKKYVWGATGENDSYDCSGLTFYISKQLGINIPRTAQAQYYGLKNEVSYNNLKAGDLVYFHTSDRCEITHCGIMINQNEFIHASSPKTGVKKSNIRSNYYKNAFRGGRRVYE